MESRVAAATRAAMETATASSPPPTESRRSSAGGGISAGISAGDGGRLALARGEGGRYPPIEEGLAGVPLGSVMDSVSTPSILHMAYVELLRALVSRLESGAAGAVCAPAALGEGRTDGDGRVAGAWAGVRALDLETLFR